MKAVMERFLLSATTVNGRIEVTWLSVHDKDQCRVRNCVIHWPSSHHMRTWPLNWRSDLGILERICPHGIGHPDPDSVTWLEHDNRGGLAVHGCDRCCIPVNAIPEDEW